MGGGRWLERKSFRRRGEKEWKVVEGKKGLKIEEGVVGRRWKFQTELGIQRGVGRNEERWSVGGYNFKWEWRKV